MIYLFQVLGRVGPPVKLDDVLDIRIDAIGKDGDGLAHYEGFVIFVHGLKKIGQRATIRIKNIQPRYAVGEVMSMVDEEKKEETPEEKKEENPVEETPEEKPEETPAEKPEEEKPAEEPEKKDEGEKDAEAEAKSE